MNLDSIKNRTPDYAKDLRVNFKNIFNATTSQNLSEEQIYATALATAIASGNNAFAREIEILAQEVLTETTLNATKSAAAIMAMNNIYYRFLHLSSNKNYARMPANLRMQVIGKPGVSTSDFELYSLAVSTINGCSACIDSHEKVLIKHGVSETAIQSAVRIASVVHAVAQTLAYSDESTQLQRLAA